MFQCTGFWAESFVTRSRFTTSYRWGNIEPTREAYARRTRELRRRKGARGKWRPFRTSGQEPGFSEPEDLREGVEVVRASAREGLILTSVSRPVGAAFNVARPSRSPSFWSRSTCCSTRSPSREATPLPCARCSELPAWPWPPAERIQSRLELREFVEWTPSELSNWMRRGAEDHGIPQNGGDGGIALIDCGAAQPEQPGVARRRTCISPRP